MAYQVTLSASGHSFQINEKEPILDAGIRAGIGLPYGCRNGTCGSCFAQIERGEVSYPSAWPPAINEEEAASGGVLLCQAYARSDLVLKVREVEAAADIEVKTLPCRVMSLTKLSHDVMQVKLKLPANERLLFLAGQYIDIIMRDGRRRGFSIATPPHDDEFLELHIRHVPGGAFTTHVFEQMKEKAILRFQGPLGTFFLREESNRPIILMGGGTGFAPLKGMLEHVFHTGIERPIKLYWGVRAKRDLYMNDLIQEWASQHASFDYIPVLSEPAPEDEWQGRTGWVHDAVLQDHADLSAHEVYMSGPPPMINAAREAFAVSGLPQENLFYDSFDFTHEVSTR